MSSLVVSDEEDTAITNGKIRSAIAKLLPTIDLETTGTKKFRALLSKRYFEGADLSGQTKFIREALTEAINEAAEAEEEEEEKSESDEESEEEESEEEEAPKKKKKNSKGGYNKPQQLSDKLGGFLGTKEMSRPQIVKSMWEYIKAKDLQNPKDKREILCDKKMKKVFGCDSFTMFSMNKYISHHCHPFPPLDLTSKPKKVTPTKRKAAASDDGAKKKRKAGTQPPYRLSQALVDVVQKEILPRPQVVSELWVYIKANELQNPKDKRQILCDKKLQKVFGGLKSVTMFSMNKHITPHLLEKVDKSEYEAPPSEDSD